MIKFLLDSGDPSEYREIAALMKAHNEELWGSTTNPSLIAKKLEGKKLTQKEAFDLQEGLVREILDFVPGPVSAEVYADTTTTAADMIAQGKEIASWDKRVVVKLPTTLEGMKARTKLRENGITINNTLVFSQEQVLAITLHEKFMIEMYGPTTSGFPCFISPFIGRLDDKGQNGMSFVRNSLMMLEKYFPKDTVWMLIASVRNVEHLKASIDSTSQLVTVPAKVFRDWFALSASEQNTVDYKISEQALTPIPPFMPSNEVTRLDSLESLMNAVSHGKLDITHPLTDAGIVRFVEDWKKILS